jgi:chromosome segregation ATPase
VLAQGDLADYIRRKLPMLTELSLVDALILDRVAELHNDLKAVSEELQQTRAKSEARKLEALNAKRDAAAAREAATGLPNLVLRLHEELRLGRTERLGLQQQVAELQHSRWRRIGLLLGLARKATFER